MNHEHVTFTDEMQVPSKWWNVDRVSIIKTYCLHGTELTSSDMLHVFMW